MTLGVTVEEAMKIGGLKKSTIVAGHAGLHNLIRYVSVIELPEVDDWIRGKELFITAFYSIGNDVQAQMELLRKMKEHDVSALGVCYPGIHYEQLTREFLYLADQLEIPIIEIPREVAYVDIISPITERIHNSYGKFITKTLTLHQLFPEWIEQGVNFHQLTNKLSRYIDYSIAICNERFDLLAIAGKDVNDEQVIRNWLNARKQQKISLENPNTYYAIQGKYLYVTPISLKKEHIGYHLIVSDEQIVDTILLTILSTNLVLYISHPTQNEEAVAIRKESLIQDLLTGECDYTKALQRAKELRWELQSIVGLALMDDRQMEELKRTSGEKLEWFNVNGVHGFFLYEHQLTTAFPQLCSSFQMVYCLQTALFRQDCALLFQRLSNLLTVQRHIPNVLSCLDITTFPLINLFPLPKEQHAMFLQLINPLLHYAKTAEDEDLFTTFLYSLFSDDNATITQALHIHKNTLNYRRRKISEIIGMNPFHAMRVANYQMAVCCYIVQGCSNEQSKG